MTSYLRDDGQGNFVLHRVLGHPVYENSPRLIALPRYMDDADVSEKYNKYIVELGIEDFLIRPDWRSNISNYARQLVDDLVDHEYEIAGSKKIIDTRLNKEVRHFCYP